MKKASGKKTPPQTDSEEFLAAHALEYRLSELLLACEGVAIGMSDDFVFEVWGKLRFTPKSEMVKLAAARGDLREAVRLAHATAHELQMPRLVQVINPKYTDLVK